MSNTPLDIVQPVDDFITKNLTGDRLIISTGVDAVLKWTPIVSSLVFRQDKSGTGSQLMYHAKLIAASETILNGIVQPLKKFVNRDAPENALTSDSFPSGNTATAFMGAELLRRGAGEKYPVIGYAGYGMAIAGAAIRVYNKRSWFSDVLAGAAVGILAVAIASAAIKRPNRIPPSS